MSRLSSTRPHAAGLALAGLLLCAATPDDALARPVGYIDVGEGDFGSMAWAGWAGMGSYAVYAGAPYRLSAQTSWSNPGDSEYGTASSSMLFGDLHALADAGSCNTTGYEDLCGAYRTSVFAGAAIWDTISFEGEAGQLIRPRLHVDGATLGAAHGQVRAYVGLAADPVAELNRLPGQGWRYLGGSNVDLEIDLADIHLGFPTGWKVFIELEVSAREGYGGNVADFGNTARFQWELPAGVTYTSASGSFMAGTSQVPEPAPLALAALGLLALGAVRRNASACGGSR